MNFFQTSLDGILFGSAYALLALGFSLIFGIMKRINLAYGSSLLLGSAIAVWINEHIGLGVSGLFLVTISATAAVNIYVERLCFFAHTGKIGVTTSMIASFAIWMQLDEISAHLLPQRTHGFPGLEIGSVEIFGLYLRGDQSLILSVTVFAISALFLFLYRTRFGLLLRASADNPETAQLLGTNVSNLGIVTFAIAGILGGTSAFLILSSDGHVTPLFGLWSTCKGLVAMMLGGVGSLVGAVLGGLLLGLVEAHTTNLLGAEYRDISTFGLLFVVLILRPGGIMGVALYRTDSLARQRI